MSPVGLANTRISTDNAQKSPRSLAGKGALEVHGIAVQLQKDGTLERKEKKT